MSGKIFHTSCVKLCWVSINTPWNTNVLSPAAESNGWGKQHSLSILDNNRLLSSWHYFTVFACVANRSKVPLWMAPHHSGPAAGFYTDIFPPWLIILGLGGSKPVMNNFWMWGISFTPGPQLTWCPEPDVPGYSVLPEEGTLVGEPFPSKFRVSSEEQQKAPIGNG